MADIQNWPLIGLRTFGVIEDKSQEDVHWCIKSIRFGRCGDPNNSWWTRCHVSCRNREDDTITVIIGWILLVGGTVTYLIALAKDSSSMLWIQILAIGIAVFGFAILKANGIDMRPN